VGSIPVPPVRWARRSLSPRTEIRRWP